VVRELQRRHGDAIQELFGIEPGALTAAEAHYLHNFRDADSLRARAVAAERENAVRAQLRGVQEEPDQGAVDQPRAPYNEAQLELIYDQAETRPGTTEGQKSLGLQALKSLFHRDRRAGATLLGSNLWRDFTEGRGADLIGQQAGSAEELALAAQVLRDPRFETLRFFFTKNGQIVGHSGVTSRMPGMVSFIQRQIGGDTLEGMEAAFGGRISELKAMMGNLGADGYWMLHNHPSGRSTPSFADRGLTERVVTSPRFPGHRRDCLPKALPVIVVRKVDCLAGDGLRRLEHRPDSSRGDLKREIPPNSTGVNLASLLEHIG